MAEVVLVRAFALVVPNQDRAVILVGLGVHDLRNNFGQEVVSLCDVGRITGVMNSIIGKTAGQRSVHVVVLVGGDEVVTGNSFVV